MGFKIVGIGEYVASNTDGDIIKTLALGSCVAVICYDREIHAAGMIHIALPDSKISPERALVNPGHFADTGIPKLMENMKKLGCNKDFKKMTVKLVGGARVMDPNNIFNIGERNVEAIRKVLKMYKLAPFAEDVGKNFSRTVQIEINNGMVTVFSSGRSCWEI